MVSVQDNKAILSFADNGSGYDRNQFPNPEVFFELGIKHSSGIGYGIGLHHIRELARENGGGASIDNEYNKGFKLVVEIEDKKAEK